MALYLGDKKLVVKVNGQKNKLIAMASQVITNGKRLISSDGYTLLDRNGTYLTVQDK